MNRFKTINNINNLLKYAKLGNNNSNRLIYNLSSLSNSYKFTNFNNNNNKLYSTTTTTTDTTNNDTNELELKSLMKTLLNRDDPVNLTTSQLNDLLQYYLTNELNINYIKLLYKIGKSENLLDTLSYSYLMKMEFLLNQGTLNNCLNYYENSKKLDKFEPVSDMYLTLIKFCLKTEKFEKLNYIQKELESNNIEINIDIINSLMNCYLIYNQPLEKFMELVNYCESQSITPNLETFEHITNAYVKFNQVHFGWSLLEKIVKTHKLEPSLDIIKKLNLNPIEVLQLLKAEGLSASLNYFNSIINWKIKQNLFREAFEWSNLMIENGHSPNTITYTLLLDALVKGERVDKAFELFEEMKSLEIALDQRIFLILIEGLNRSGNFKSSLNLLDKMIHNYKLIPNQYIFNNLLGYCSKEKDLESAKKIIGLIKEYNCKLDTRGYNCLFTLYLDTSNLEKCWKLYKQMKIEGVQGDQVTYSLLLETSNREMNSSKLLRVYEDMINYGVLPTPAQFEVVLKQLFSQSELTKFLEVWTKFINLKLVPTQSLMQVILNFCHTYNQFEVTKLSYQYLLTLINNGNLINFDKSTWQLLMDQYLNQSNYLEFEEIYYLVSDKLNIKLDKEILEEWLRVLPQDCNISFRLRVDLENFKQ